MTQYLLTRPHTLISLTAFADRYQSAKSSISEDLAIIKEVFEEEGLGELNTLAGAAGGVKYTPKMGRAEALKIYESYMPSTGAARKGSSWRLFVYDRYARAAGAVCRCGTNVCNCICSADIDVIMTVETKGIPLAYATASCMNLPVVIVRSDNKVTEGSAVSINYVSGSNKRIQTMSLARRALKEHSRVLIIDDFMKAGGTIQGMMDLLFEFNAKVAGVGVFVESGELELKSGCWRIMFHWQVRVDYETSCPDYLKKAKPRTDYPEQIMLEARLSASIILEA